MTVGLGYYYNEKNYFDLRIGATTSNEIPLPVGIDHFGSYDVYNSVFLDITTNHVVHGFLNNRFHYTIGLDYTQYKFHRWYEATVSPDSTNLLFYSKTKFTMGLTTGLKFRVFPHWLLGVKLNTSIYEFKNSSWEYNHIGYLEIIFRFGSRRD